MNDLLHEAPLDLRPAVGRGGRRILIVDFDLFKNIGGGQSVYRKLIELNPDDTFYYFRRWEAPTALRPANTVAVPFVVSYQSAEPLLPRSVAPFLYPYLDCRNFAASVVRHLGVTDFDVVDAPDYNQIGLFMRPALEAEGCRVETVALALHGTLSEAWRRSWPTGQDEAPHLAELRIRERLQMRSVDARYGLSEGYADYWRHLVPLPINLIDPLLMIGPCEPLLPEPSRDPPNLIYVGRRERYKGPDLFIDIAWWIERSSYRRLLLIGPEGPNRLGMGSREILEGMARQRDLPVDLVDGLPQEELHALFAGRNLILLPSRLDTFNLTALEAICRGCPTLVSERAGVARWLRERLPGWEALVVSIECSRTAAGRTGSFLANYDEYRARLVDTMSRQQLTADTEGLESMYRSASRRDLDARQTMVDLAALFSSVVRIVEPSGLRRAARSGLSTALATAQRLAPHLPQRLRDRAPLIRQLAQVLLRRRSGLAWDTKRQLEELLRRRTGFSPRTFAQINGARRAKSERPFMLRAGERTRQDVAAKIQSLAARIPGALVDRARLLRVLARLERRVGRDLVAVTYELRVMRWLGRDVYGDLPYVVATLKDNGFPEEAAVAAAIFGTGRSSDAACLELMQDAFSRLRRADSKPLAILDDRRNGSMPRVSAIVSLYRAADKLPTLLATLQQQSLTQRGELEVVLVDSGSPTRERQVFEQFVAAHDLPIVYARSAERETIQAAWNRGI